VEASVAGLGGTIGAYGGFNFAREPVIQASRSPTEQSRQSTIVLQHDQRSGRACAAVGDHFKSAVDEPALRI
jgi:hypothetical protein